jgi:hypothetical protein
MLALSSVLCAYSPSVQRHGLPTTHRSAVSVPMVPVMKVGSVPRSELTKKYDLVVVGGG